MDFIHYIWMAINVGNTIYVNRNRIGKFLLKYKAGRVFLAIVMLPFWIVLLYKFLKMTEDPLWIKIMTKINAQKKISDYC